MEKVSGRDRGGKHIIVGSKRVCECMSKRKKSNSKQGKRERERQRKKKKGQRERVKRGDEEKTTVFWPTKIWPGKKAGEMDFRKQTPAYSI